MPSFHLPLGQSRDRARRKVTGDSLNTRYSLQLEEELFNAHKGLSEDHLSRFLGALPWAPEEPGRKPTASARGPRYVWDTSPTLPGPAIWESCSTFTASRNSSGLFVRFYFLNKYSIFIQLGLGKPWLQSPSELSLRATAWIPGNHAVFPVVKNPAQY